MSPDEHRGGIRRGGIGTGRWSADPGDRDEIVVFLTRMRIDRSLNVRRRWSAFRAMTRMLREPSARTASGLPRSHARPGAPAAVPATGPRRTARNRTGTPDHDNPDVPAYDAAPEGTP